MSHFSTSKLDLYNRNEDRICDAYGCKKHKTLMEYRGGLFCNIHCRELDIIRKDIDHSVSEKELMAREEEIRLRKIFDPGHVYYANSLRSKLEKR